MDQRTNSDWPLLCLDCQSSLELRCVRKLVSHLNCNDTVCYCKFEATILILCCPSRDDLQMTFITVKVYTYRPLSFHMGLQSSMSWISYRFFKAPHAADLPSVSSTQIQVRLPNRQKETSAALVIFSKPLSGSEKHTWSSESRYGILTEEL